MPVYDNPNTFRSKINNDQSFNEARNLFKQARIDKKGVFNTNGIKPLVLEPFELRYLGRKSCPSRWFIDLDSNDNILHTPVKYFQHYPEDRLFIPEHYVPLFISKGWVKQ